MGYGDDIMATAYARAAVEEHPSSKVFFGDPNNPVHPFWSPVFANNPFILQPKKNIQENLRHICIPDFPGSRRYIDYKNSRWGYPNWAGGRRHITEFCWKFGFRAPRGDLFFSNDEIRKAKKISKRLPNNFIVIEPNIATKPWTNNKGWNWSNWQTLVNRCPDIPFVQFGKEGPWLEGVPTIKNTFREATALLTRAQGLVTTEGGLHHAAAAIHKPAVVLWGHFSSPATLGYDGQINLRQATGQGCGRTEFCSQCTNSMNAITITSVESAVRRSLCQ